MGVSDWAPKKSFDLRERLLEFACLIVRVVQFLHTRGPMAASLSYQLLNCGTSAGANYEEADDGRCDMLTQNQDPVINESDELIWIVATLLRNAPPQT